MKCISFYFSQELSDVGAMVKGIHFDKKIYKILNGKKNFLRPHFS